MIFSRRSAFFSLLIAAAVAVTACSPREQSRSKRWKEQADAFLQDREAPSESAWPIRISEDDEDDVVKQKVTFPDLIEALPSPQSWPHLQNGMVLRFLSAQAKGEWEVEIQNRLLHLFFIYLNDLDRYSVKRWDKAVTRLDARLEAIEKKLPENSPDTGRIRQIRREVAAADAEVQVRFQTKDGLAEVKAFEDRLKKLLPPNRDEVAGMVGGETALAKMENTWDEIRVRLAKLIAKANRGSSEMSVNQKLLDDKHNSEQLKNPKVAVYFQEWIMQKGVTPVMVPDLVTILGERKAADLLQRALHQQVELDIRTGEETKALARHLALEEMDELKAGQWRLAQSLQSTVLFEALQKKFPERGLDGENINDRNDAGIYYLFGLIAQNRSDEALAWMEKIYARAGEEGDYGDIPSDLLDQMEKAGYGEQVWNFLAKMLDRYPDVPFWHDFIDLSATLHKNAEMLQLVEKAAKRPGLKDEARWKMQNVLAKGYLAADRVDDGVMMLRSVLAQAGTDSGVQTDRYEAGVQLAELGQLLQRAEWIQEGIAAAETHVANIPQKDMNYGRISKLVMLYEKLGRNTDAERLVRSGLEKWTAAKEEAERDAGDAKKSQDGFVTMPRRVDDSAGTTFLEALLALKVNQNQDAGAIELLTQSRQWNKADLAGLLNNSTGYPKYPVGYWAAWALGRLGKTDEAVAVSKGQIRVVPGSDGAYAILTQLKGTEAVPFLDQIYRMDQFEERPLIWKAKVLADAGDLGDADAAARLAITVDPSDGEQGKGDRMRAYAVMQEIEQKKGDKEKAKFYGNILSAIRLSEDADDFAQAGLKTRAIEMYGKALGFFSDAYCIQSRLARRLSEENKEAEALEHYQKAFELMPDSFGRVESHCFGCERAFAGEKAQGVAEKVFMQLLKKEPAKPQIHYLLGYLREEQHRYSEALDLYQQAVALDPLYLNAWKRINGLREYIRIDPRVLDRVQLQLLALDPLRRHSYPNLESINDLHKLWGHLELADRTLDAVPLPEAVFELTASTEALQEKYGNGAVPSGSYKEETTFAKVLLKHPAIRALERALEMSKNIDSPKS